MKVLGEDHKDTLDTFNNLGHVLVNDDNYEKALEYNERVLTGKESILGKNHPLTFNTMECIACVYYSNLKDYGKAESRYQKALEGYEAQLGKDHKSTMSCAEGFSLCLKFSRNSERLN